MTKEQYDYLGPEMKIMAELLMEILRELKGINRSVTTEIEANERVVS